MGGAVKFGSGLQRGNRSQLLLARAAACVPAWRATHVLRSGRRCACSDDCFSNAPAAAADVATCLALSLKEPESTPSMRQRLDLR